MYFKAYILNKARPNESEIGEWRTSVSSGIKHFLWFLNFQVAFSEFFFESNDTQYLLKKKINYIIFNVKMYNYIIINFT